MSRLRRQTFFRKKPPLIPDPGQQVRLRTERGLWKEGFRAISEPTTANTGEVVIWVAEEGEYRNAIREGRHAVGMPWPAERMMVVFSTPAQDGAEVPQEEPPGGASESAGEQHNRVEESRSAQEGSSQRPWWRRVSRSGTSSEVAEVTAPELMRRLPEEFERYTRTKPPQT